MPYKVVKYGNVWLTIDTQSHAVKGRHPSRSQAMEQRRVLETLRRRKRRK